MKKHYGLIIALAFLLVQLALLPQAGMTWDEPSSFFFGRANLKFWLTGNRKYVTDIRDTKLYSDSTFPYIYGEDLYPPFTFVVESATSYVFAEHLHLLPVIDAHHLGEVLLGVVGIWAFYGIAVETGITSFAAALATICYGLYPTIFGQMRSDAKDVPLMSVLTLFVYVAIRFIESLKKKSFWLHLRWAIAAGIAFGLAFASKTTAPVIVIPLVLWFIISLISLKPFRKGVGSAGRLVPLLLLAGFIGISVFFLAWPWLWDDPVGKLTQIWQFFRVVGLGMPVQYFGQTLNAGWSLPRVYPFTILLIQTPVEITVLALFGMGAALWVFFKKSRPYGLLALLWFWSGMGRFLVPGIIIYAKVRHFIDAMPAFFLLAGLGIAQVQTILMGLRRPRAGKIIFYILAAGILVHLLWIDATLYPYEPSYFNALVGGTKYVAATNRFDVEYWGSTIAEGMRWVARQPGLKRVYACDLRHVALFYADPTITITGAPEVGDYVLVPNTYSWFRWPKSVYSSEGAPVYTVTRAGADLMDIYKINSTTWWCGQETDMDPPAGSL